MCVANVCKPGCDVMNFEVNLSSQVVYLHDKSGDKNLNTLRTKRSFKKN